MIIKPIISQRSTVVALANQFFKSNPPDQFRGILGHDTLGDYMYDLSYGYGTTSIGLRTPWSADVFLRRKTDNWQQLWKGPYKDLMRHSGIQPTHSELG